MTFEGSTLKKPNSVSLKLSCWLHSLHLRSMSLVTVSGRSNISWYARPKTVTHSPKPSSALSWLWCTSSRATLTSVHDSGSYPSSSQGHQSLPNKVLRCLSSDPQADVPASAHLCPHRSAWWSGMGLHSPTRGVSPVPIPQRVSVPCSPQLRPYWYWTEWKRLFCKNTFLLMHHNVCFPCNNMTLLAQFQ